MLALLLGCTDYGILYEETIKVPDDTGEADTDPVDDTDTPWDTDTTDTAIEETGDTEDTEPAACERILVYSTEGTAGGDRFTGIFDGLRTDATLARWDVDVAERVEDGLLSDTLLAGASQLWVFGTDRDASTALALSEVSAIRDFVNGGGGVLLAGGPEDGTGSYTEDINLVAEAYGVELHDTYREGTDGDTRAVEDADSTLLAGVRELPVFASVAELSLNDSAVKVAATLGGSAAIAYRDDGKRIVFDRSWQGWQDSYRATGDQSVYVGNVATFLEPCAE